MLSFRAERWAAIEAELELIAQAHWEEMGLDEPLDLDRVFYAALDAAERLLIITARDGTRLVGYFFHFLARHPHYEIKTAAMDVYFLSPEYRKGTAAFRLFQAMEEACRERGVGLMLATARLGRSPGAARLMERMGWIAARTVYQKRMR